MDIFSRAIKSVMTIYTVKLNSKVNILKTIPTKLTKIVKKQIQRIISFLFGKPTTLQEYYKVEDWYVSKRFVLKSFFVVAIIVAFCTMFLYPFFEGKLWYAKLTVNTSKFHEFSGKALVYDEKDDLIYQGILENGLPNGVGEAYKEEQLVYQGELVNNVRTGTGQEYFKGNLIYEGSYVLNLYEGEGVKYFPTNAKQIHQTGTFLAGQLEEGTEYFENGDRKYIGTLENGLKHGTGTTYENDEITYNGEFAKDLKNGVGTLYKNGQIFYRGQFVDDVYQGTGELYENGTILYKGSFMDNAYYGNGELYENGDLIYTGNFINNLRQGEGIAYAETTGKKVYEGGFRNDLYEGVGTLYDSKTGRICYTGEFANGLYDGFGTSYTNSGQQLFTGLFFQGNLDYIQFCNAEETTIKEAFGNEDYLEMFSYSYFTVYQNADIVFEYHFSVDGQAPRLGNMKLMGDQEIQGVKVGMTMTEIENLLGEEVPYSAYPFMIDENEQYILRMINSSKTIGDTLYTAKYNFDDYYIRCYANSWNGEVLYYEVGGN